MTNSLQTLLFTFVPYDRQGLDDSTESKTIIVKDVIPEELSYAYTPLYTAQQVLGRMSPIQLYTGGSDMTYAFTLSMHEDALDQKEYTDISKFVDDLKALAYPYIDDAGIMRAQRVYFQIGEITGWGYVNVSISWKKPFRNGRYIMADIAFTITVEEIYPVAIMVTGDEIADDEVSFAVYHDTTRIDESTTGIITALSSFIGYDMVISDFILNDNISDIEKQSNINYTELYFDNAQSRFGSLLTMLSGLDPSSEDMYNIKTAVANLDNIEFLDLTQGRRTDFSVPRSRFSDYETIKQNLDDLLEDFTDYIEGYYDNVDKNMLESEKDALIDDITLTVNDMLEMWEKVYKYGASN